MEALTEGAITKKDALAQIMSTVEQFAEQGLFFWDVTIPNLCVVNGQVKLLDPGSVCPIAERYKGQMGNDTHSNDDKFQANLAHICSELGEWTQSVGKRSTASGVGVLH